MKCPKCGTETDAKFCPECGTPLTQNDGAYDGPSYDSTSNSLNQKKKHSGLGIASFVLSFLGPLAFIGIILAIIDLIKDKTKAFKHGLSIAAIIIGVLMLAAFGTSGDSDTETTESNTQIEKSESDEPQADTKEDKTESAKSEENKDDVVQDDEPVEPQISKDDFIASCLDLSENYKAIARNPSEYENQNFYFTCYVSDAREGGLFTGYQKYYITYEFDLDEAYSSIKQGWADDLDDAKYSGMNYDKSVWLLDNRDTSDPEYVKILDDDIIKVYGTFTGMTETKNSLNGEKGEQLSLDIKYVELIEE